MRKNDTLYCDKKTLNTGYIYFSDFKKAKRMEDILRQLHMRYVTFVEKENNSKRYGFRIFNIKRKFFKFCVLLEEVTN